MSDHEFVRTNTYSTYCLYQENRDVFRNLAHRGAPSRGVRLAERGAAPAGRLATCTRATRGSAWGTPGSPAESRLIGTAQAVLESAARARPEAAVERREARRPASSAGDLGRTRDLPDREAGHGDRK